MKKQTKLYNVLFPIWMIWLFPPVIFISLVVNFMVDYLVILLTLKSKKVDNYIKISNKKIWSTWIFGFLADFIASGFLFILSFYIFGDTGNDFIYKVFSNVFFNPFGDIVAFLICSISISIAGFFIYYFNKKIVFKNSELNEDIIKRLCLNLAIFTAPYFFLFPMGIFYR